MNDKAKKAARRAELEWALLGEYMEGDQIGFAEWLEEQSGRVSSWWHAEAIELIALYGEA